MFFFAVTQLNQPLYLSLCNQHWCFYSVTMQPCSILACDFTGTREMFLGFDDDAEITKIFFDNGSNQNLCFPHQTMGLNMNIKLSLWPGWWKMELVISVSKGSIKRSSSVVVPRLPRLEFIDIVIRSLRNMWLCSSHCCCIGSKFGNKAIGRAEADGGWS